MSTVPRYSIESLLRRVPAQPQRSKAPGKTRKTACRLRRVNARPARRATIRRDCGLALAGSAQDARRG